MPFVVIDDNPEVREYAEEMDVLLIEGRGSDDEVMMEAGIERACAVIACVDSDAENIFATLTARELRPDIPIVARAAVESSERKLIRAGANEVVSPYKASGRTMASLALVERGDALGRGVRDAVAVDGAGRPPPPVTPARASGPGAAPARSSGCARSWPRPPRRCAGGSASAPPPTLERPPRAEFGDFSTNVAMLLAPALKAPPREIAERVGGGARNAAGRGARARRGRGPRLPQPVPVRRLVPRARSTACASRASGSARASLRPASASGSWSSS